MKHDLSKLRHVVMDMDGTIYHGKHLFPTTIPFLKRLESLGIGYTFLTNNSSRSIAEYLEHLKGFGISAGKEQMYSSTLGAVEFLKKKHPEIRKLFLLGTASFRAEMQTHGFHDVSMQEEPDAVVTGFDTSLTYERLCKAAWWIKRNKLWLATHPDPECPTEQETTLVDCGSICACLEKVSGRQPLVLGKPDPSILFRILERNALSPEECAMCGDRLDTDLLLARNAGVTGVLIHPEAPESIPGNFADITVSHLERFGEKISLAKQNGR